MSKLSSKMSSVTTVAVDLAKHVFQVDGCDASGITVTVLDCTPTFHLADGDTRVALSPVSLSYRAQKMPHSLHLDQPVSTLFDPVNPSPEPVPCKARVLLHLGLGTFAKTFVKRLGLNFVRFHIVNSNYSFIIRSICQISQIRKSHDPKLSLTCTVIPRQNDAQVCHKALVRVISRPSFGMDIIRNLN